MVSVEIAERMVAGMVLVAGGMKHRVRKKGPYGPFLLPGSVLLRLVEHLGLKVKVRPQMHGRGAR